MNRSARRALAIFLVAVPAASLLASPAQAVTESQKYANQAYRATNAQRVERDIHRLKADACMQRFAVRQARHNADVEKVPNLNLDKVQKACDLHYVIELNAKGDPDSTGTSLINDTYMGDAGGRREVLRKRSEFMGYGAATSENGTWYFVALWGERV